MYLTLSEIYRSRKKKFPIFPSGELSKCFIKIVKRKNIYSPPGLTSLVVQMVKRLPTMQETWVPSLGREDPLEKEMATHSSILASKILRTKEPSRLQSMGSQSVGHNIATSLQD